MLNILSSFCVKETLFSSGKILNALVCQLKCKVLFHRNSPTFKSFEDRVENLKVKVFSGVRKLYLDFNADRLLNLRVCFSQYKVVGGNANGESAHSPNDSNPVQDNAPF